MTLHPSYSTTFHHEGKKKPRRNETKEERKRRREKEEIEKGWRKKEKKQYSKDNIEGEEETRKRADRGSPFEETTTPSGRGWGPLGGKKIRRWKTLNGNQPSAHKEPTFLAGGGGGEEKLFDGWGAECSKRWKTAAGARG